MSVACGVLPCDQISSTQTSARGKGLVLARQCKASGMARSRREGKLTRNLRKDAFVSPMLHVQVDSNAASFSLLSPDVPTPAHLCTLE